jgi:hypothetical protein
MGRCKQPKEYFMIEYGFDGEVVIETFFSSIPEKMENPEMYGMTWEQVQKTLHKHYNDISKTYTDIASDWSTKTCEEYYNPPKTNQDIDWDELDGSW